MSPSSVIRYADACRDYYTPFLQRHEHLLENYLVSYAYKTVFPFGQPSEDALGECHPDPTQQYMVMASYYAMIRATMIGLSANYQSNFGVEHIVRCIQVSSRAFEHCLAYPPRILEILAANSIRTAIQMSLAAGT